jgi:hypothetical protein
LEEEGRLRSGETADSAADDAFALTTPAIYEELVVLRQRTLADAIDMTTRAVLGVILDPTTQAVIGESPDWAALETAAATRAKGAGADPMRLSQAWRSTPEPTGGA